MGHPLTDEGEEGDDKEQQKKDIHNLLQTLEYLTQNSAMYHTLHSLFCNVSYTAFIILQCIIHCISFLCNVSYTAYHNSAMYHILHIAYYTLRIIFIVIVLVFQAFLFHVCLYGGGKSPKMFFPPIYA